MLYLSHEREDLEAQALDEAGARKPPAKGPGVQELVLVFLAAASQTNMQPRREV